MGVTDDGWWVLCVFVVVQPLFWGNGELGEGSGLPLTWNSFENNVEKKSQGRGEQEEGGRPEKKMVCELGLGVEDVKHQA